MNARDREALRALTHWGANGFPDRQKCIASEEHFRARLEHLDALEYALAWRETPGGRSRVWNRAYALEYEFLRDGVAVATEAHDGTPAGRAAALVRLHQRVTGERR